MYVTLSKQRPEFSKFNVKDIYFIFLLTTEQNADIVRNCS